MNQVYADLLYLSACAVRGRRPEQSRAERMDMEQLYRASRFHSLTGLVFEAVSSAYDGKLPDTPVLRKWREAREMAVTKNLLLDAERGALFAWMEEQGIWYLPLKGCILKDFYPKSGMRQMADNDILFDAAYSEQVRDWFAARGYEAEEYGVGAHDCYLKAPVYNFEMHRTLFSDAFQPENRVWAEYYRDVKRRLLPDEAGRYGRHFSDEDFYLYITAHACKHFREGGTGLRTLLDVYVYLSAKGGSLDWGYIHAELPKLKLVEFERRMRELAEKVFADPENSAARRLSEAEENLLERFLASGVYGTVGQRVKNGLSRLGETESSAAWKLKIRYLRSRLFPDRVFMENWCESYAPFFLRRKGLLPAAAFWRIFVRGFANIRKCAWELLCLIRTK